MLSLRSLVLSHTRSPTHTFSLNRCLSHSFSFSPPLNLFSLTCIVSLTQVIVPPTRSLSHSSSFSLVFSLLSLTHCLPLTRRPSHTFSLPPTLPPSHACFLTRSWSPPLILSSASRSYALSHAHCLPLLLLQFSLTLVVSLTRSLSSPLSICSLSHALSHLLIVPLTRSLSHSSSFSIVFSLLSLTHFLPLTRRPSHSFSPHLPPLHRRHIHGLTILNNQSSPLSSHS